RARQALRLRDLDVALEFHRRVGRQPVLPLSDQVVPLLRQAVQVRALPLVARTLRPAVSDPSIQVLNLTTQVLDLLLSDTASLLELGPSLLRGHRLRLRPHLVDIIRRQVPASRDRQMLARRKHLVDQANRLIHQGLERQTSLAHVLHPLLPLRRVLSPVEKSVLALSQRIPHGTRVGPDSVVDDRRVRLVPLLSNLRVLRGVRDLAIPNPELPLAPLSSRRLDHPVHRIERIRDVRPHVQRVVVSVQQRRRNELARVRVEPALVTQRLPQHRLATTNLLVASSGPSSRSTLLRLPSLNQSLLAQLNVLDEFVPEIQVSLRGLVKRVQTLERRPAVSQVRLELLDLLRETHRGPLLHILTPLIRRHVRDLPRTLDLLIQQIHTQLDLSGAVVLRARRLLLPLERVSDREVRVVHVLEIHPLLHEPTLKDGVVHLGLRQVDLIRRHPTQVRTRIQETPAHRRERRQHILGGQDTLRRLERVT